MPILGGGSEFLHEGARLLDARSYFFVYATGITPAMAVSEGRRRFGVSRCVRGRAVELQIFSFAHAVETADSDGRAPLRSSAACSSTSKR